MYCAMCIVLAFRITVDAHCCFHKTTIWLSIKQWPGVCFFSQPVESVCCCPESSNVTSICFSPSLQWLIHSHTRLTALFPGLLGWAVTRKVKPIWILLKQETVSGGGISWDICKSATRSRQITTPAPHHSCFFTGRMPFLLPNQQRQSTEGLIYL